MAKKMASAATKKLSQNGGCHPQTKFGGAAATGHGTPKRHRLGVAPGSGSSEIVSKTRESHEARARRAAEIARRLIEAYPDATIRLHYSTPFELLVATILAAQCTDDRVNRVTADLFKRAGTPEKLARMPLAAIEKTVRSTGFFRNKAKAIKAMSRELVEKHGGRVPEAMEDLVALPGVARKTANVVRAGVFGLPAIITDTHFIRLAQRMGLTSSEKPEKIERDAMALLPEASWSAFSHAMLFHGRAVCQARKPACDRCVVSALCPSAFRFPPIAKEPP